jgi:hypothetical protein
MESEETMDVYKLMITRARKRHGNDIGGCQGLPLSSCFKPMNGLLFFWYNDFKTDSTHIVKYDPIKKAIVE